MAGQRENDEVEREISEAFEPVSRLRPSHRVVRMWGDLEALLERIRVVEFLLGLRMEKPTGGVDIDQIEHELHDARARIGLLALALSDEAENA